MSGHIFTLGTTPQLCLEELNTVLRRHSIVKETTILNKHQYFLDVHELPITALARELGGTVKISKIIQKLDARNLLNDLKYQNLQLTKPLALSSFDYSQEKLKSIAYFIKGFQLSLKAKRFRILKNPHQSSGINTKFTEWQLIKDHDLVILAETIAVQPISRWSQKDYGRPFRDARSGMLPPKIARIMVNLATPKIKTNSRIYDPFCGSGTILNEVLDLGMNAFGSDISKQAVDNAAKNCRWFKDNFDIKSDYQVFLKDVAHLEKADLSAIPDAIVFEGYLGPPHPKPEKINNLIKGLTKLYIGAFKSLSKIQTSGTRLVCALPQFHHNNRVKTLHNLVDSCEKYGYTLLCPPLTYGRKSAKIKRSIIIFERK